MIILTSRHRALRYRQVYSFNPEEIEILTSVNGLDYRTPNKSDVAQVVTDENIKEHGTFTAIERQC